MPKKPIVIINIVDALIAYSAAVSNPYVAPYRQKGIALDRFHEEFRKLIAQVNPDDVDIERSCPTSRTSQDRLSKLMV